MGFSLENPCLQRLTKLSPGEHLCQEQHEEQHEAIKLAREFSSQYHRKNTNKLTPLLYFYCEQNSYRNSFTVLQRQHILSVEASGAANRRHEDASSLKRSCESIVVEKAKHLTKHTGQLEWKSTFSFKSKMFENPTDICLTSRMETKYKSSN